MSEPSRERRVHDRFSLSPMYTSVSARSGGEPSALTGHIYDISRGGLRIELDEPLAPGTDLALDLSLPGEGGELHARACVVWVGEPDDDPGPRRMALRFTGFGDPRDEERLSTYLASGAARRAA
jgi:uncharacterized protein (TIGR02266 family)